MPPQTDPFMGFGAVKTKAAPVQNAAPVQTATGGTRTAVDGAQGLFDPSQYPAEWFTDEGLEGAYVQEGSTRHDNSGDSRASVHKYWSPESVRQKLEQDAERVGQPSPTDQQVHEAWMSMNTHADNYRTDPEYQAEWDASHGNGNLVGDVFNAVVGGVVLGGIGGELLGAGSGAVTPTGPDAGSFPTAGTNALSGAANGIGGIADAVPAGVDPITGNAISSPLSIGGPAPTNSLANIGTTAGSAIPTIASGAPDALNLGAAPVATGAINNLPSVSTTPAAPTTTPNIPPVNPGLTGTPWLDNALIAGSSLASGYLANESAQAGIDEIGRQYDQTRADMEPWRNAGVNALGQYQDALAGGPGGVGYDAFSAPSGSDLPTYAPTQGPDAYQGSQDFEFNLENDDVYNFAKNEGLRATERAMAARGFNQSGNILNELNDRAVGIASQYQNDAFNRQLGASNTNYGRGVTDYGINNARNQDIYNRNLTDYGVGTDRANTNYNRGVNEYGMNQARDADIYGRGQNYLNRIAALSGTGQTSVNQLGQFGANAAANTANLYGQQGEGINNALQGGISNYLVNNYLRRS